jgi:hypothetical protein
MATVKRITVYNATFKRLASSSICCEIVIALPSLVSFDESGILDPSSQQIPIMSSNSGEVRPETRLLDGFSARNQPAFLLNRSSKTPVRKGNQVAATARKPTELGGSLFIAVAARL